MLSKHPARFILVSLLTATALGAVSQPQYKVKIERNVRPVMRDGVEIGAVVVRPDAPGKFPAIMNYTPYRTLSRVKSSYEEEKYSNTTHGPAYFAERGYAVVYYDVRGTGNSGGSSQDIYPKRSKTTPTTWSNGLPPNPGAMAASACGGTPMAVWCSGRSASRTHRTLRRWWWALPTTTFISTGSTPAGRYDPCSIPTPR